MIYFLRAGPDGPVKIGWSSDPQKRAKLLQCGNPQGFELIRTLEAPRWAESWFHRCFASLAVGGEWFSYSPDMLAVEPPTKEEAQISLRVPDDILVWLQARAQAGNVSVSCVVTAAIREWLAARGAC